MSQPTMDQIVSLCKRKGFVYPGSEIYGGFGNSYTYGPYGVEIKNNIKKLWWQMFVHNRPDIVGIDGDIILHPKTWEASGHVGGFNDLLIEDPETRHRFRADHLIEDQYDTDVEGWDLPKVNEYVKNNPLKSPTSGNMLTGPVKQFNLMFHTEMNKASTGAGEEASNKAYLRPETAQAIFLEFKNVVDSTRVKIPFGIAQQGKAFRNEITPGNFIFRRLEFEQMEIEYFIAPPAGFNERRETYMAAEATVDDWEEADKKYIYDFFVAWQDNMKTWSSAIGLSPEKCHDCKHAAEKLSHYSKLTVDIEYDFPFGKKELYGLAYRTDFDLTQHENHSGKKLKYRDPITNDLYIPHVLEPTFGLDRTILAVLCEAYTEDILEDGSSRLVMKFRPKIAPVKVAVLPLMKKNGMPAKAQEVLEMLQIFGNCELDVSGSIGKRYRRQDEIGTPLCVTIDFDTIEVGTVTVRDRDTMKQETMKIEDLVGYVGKKLNE